MRLVCPNCGATYEVDARVIPDSGRDVQCSACGHAWYQRPADMDGETDHDAPPPPPSDDSDIADEADFADDADLPAPSDDGASAPAAATGVAPGIRRRKVDEGVRDILREEAERELAVRSREHDPAQVESQPELGIDAGEDPEEERRRLARERMARMRGLDVDEDPDTAFDRPMNVPDEPAEVAESDLPRRDRFPDIEEINSTLDSHDSPNRGKAATRDTAKRGGFGRGFSWVVLLAVIAVLVYMFTPQIVAKLPAAEPALTAYVDAVNSARIWLDDNVQALIAKIEQMANAPAE